MVGKTPCLRCLPVQEQGVLAVPFREDFWYIPKPSPQRSENLASLHGNSTVEKGTFPNVPICRGATLQPPLLYAGRGPHRKLLSHVRPIFSWYQFVENHVWYK